MQDPLTVCVLGTFRSGTSLTARLVNLLGVDFGDPTHLKRPAPDNPTGFWENRRVLKMNRQILSRLGRDAFRPQPMPDGWEQRPDLQDLTSCAAQLLRDEFGDAERRGWKDPKTCLTLPFWQMLVPSLAQVVCIRHPADVARSMERWGFPFVEGLHLWLVYTGEVMRNGSCDRRMFVFYDDLVDDWSAIFAGLRSLVDPDGASDLAAAEREAGRLVDRGLRHHDACMCGWPDGSASMVPRPLRSAFAELYRKLRGSIDAAACVSEIGSLLEMMQPLLMEHRRRRHDEWTQSVEAAVAEVGRCLPHESTFLLVDDGKWDAGACLVEHRRLPFLERDGQYWGNPADDASAIAELERMRLQGAEWIVFGWPAFWWLSHYAAFAAYLQSHFHCVLQTERTIVFDLRDRQAAWAGLPEQLAT